MPFPVMIMAYNKGEKISDAIPYDIIEIENKDETALLALKKGNYEIVVCNEEKAAVKFELSVK